MSIRATLQSLLGSRDISEPTPGVSAQVTWDDYKVGVDIFKLLADVRFKLLALVPTISGAAIVLLSRDLEAARKVPVTSLVIGALGLVVTLGVVIYDQRNSQISNATFFRLQWLEHQLEIHEHGQFTTRPKRELRLFGLWTIWHDRGLSLIYGAVLGAWVFPIADSVLQISDLKTVWGVEAVNASAVLALLFGIMFIVEMYRLDRAASRSHESA
jgi:hypothetical protein